MSPFRLVRGGQDLQTRISNRVSTVRERVRFIRNLSR